MTAYLQRLFSQVYTQARGLVRKNDCDYVVIDTKEPGDKRFRVCKADTFFHKNLKMESVVCYMATPNTNNKIKLAGGKHGYFN